MITNAGFELVSEALYLGKRLLVKPLARQTEQASNALAVDMLGLGIVMKELDRNSVSRFLKSPGIDPINYPDVAYIIAKCVDSGDWVDMERIARAAWAKIYQGAKKIQDLNRRKSPSYKILSGPLS